MSIVIDGSSGRRVTGECTVGVWECNSSLAAFVRSLADDWAGFEGERTYDSIEGHISLVCRHDG